MSRGGIWKVLGISRTTDQGEIRRAYARELKKTSPEDDAEGFASLRSAYESAMQYARAAAQHDDGEDEDSRIPALSDAADTEAPAAQTAVTQAPSAETDIEIAQLRAAFLAMQTAAQRDDTTPEQMRTLLRACVDSPALDHVTTRIEFEHLLAVWLWDNRERPSVLLTEAIEAMNWKAEGQIRQHDGIETIVRYAEFLRWMKGAGFDKGKVARALTQPPRPLWLQMQIVFGGLYGEVREVLQRLHEAGGQPPSHWNEEAVAWWQSYFSGPQPRKGLIITTTLLTFVGVLAALVTYVSDGKWFPAVLWPLGILGGGVALTAFCYFAIDLPIARAHERGLPSRFRLLGWAPAAIALGLLASVVPESAFIAVLVAALSAALAGWCYWMSRRLARQGTELTGMAIYSLIVMNIPLMFWCYLESQNGNDDPTWAMLAAVAGWLVMMTIGRQLLATALPESVQDHLEKRGPYFAIGIAVVVMLTIPLLPDTLQWNRPLFMAMVVIVLAHRLFAFEQLTEGQLQVRHYICVLPMIGLSRTIADDGKLAMTHFFGELFMAGVILTSVVCLYNQRQSRVLHR